MGPIKHSTISEYHFNWQDSEHGLSYKTDTKIIEISPPKSLDETVVKLICPFQSFVVKKVRRTPMTTIPVNAFLLVRAKKVAKCL